MSSVVLGCGTREPFRSLSLCWLRGFFSELTAFNHEPSRGLFCRDVTFAGLHVHQQELRGDVHAPVPPEAVHTDIFQLAGTQVC